MSASTLTAIPLEVSTSRDRTKAYTVRKTQRGLAGSELVQRILRGQEYLSYDDIVLAVDITVEAIRRSCRVELDPDRRIPHRLPRLRRARTGPQSENPGSSGCTDPSST